MRLRVVTWLQAILRGMEFTHEQFIDLCILMGCDYSDTIKGVGPANIPAVLSRRAEQFSCAEQFSRAEDSL